jgi:uncharacterized membrane protein required for colicin V production
MSILDTFLIIILAGFIFYGFFYGLIRTFGALVALAVGALAAGYYYEVIFYWVDELFLKYQNIGKAIVILVIFSIVNRLVGFGFHLLDQIFEVVSIIPFMKTINRLGGAVLGLVTGVLAIGLGLAVMQSFFGGWYDLFSRGAAFVPFFNKGARLLFALLPWVIVKFKNWVLSFVF